MAAAAYSNLDTVIGQALSESMVYDADGELLTGSFVDYAMPRAVDFPHLGFESHPVSARTHPLGVKGCGEAGCAGSLPSVMSAVVMRCQSSASIALTCRRHRTESGRRSRRCEQKVEG